MYQLIFSFKMKLYHKNKFKQLSYTILILYQEDTVHNQVSSSSAPLNCFTSPEQEVYSIDKSDGTYFILGDEFRR